MQRGVVSGVLASQFAEEHVPLPTEWLLRPALPCPADSVLGTSCTTSIFFSLLALQHYLDMNRAAVKDRHF
jgi:hypothetical protein